MAATMAASPDYSCVHRFLSVAAGIVLIGTAFFLEIDTPGDGVPPSVRLALVMAGCGLAVLGVRARPQKLSAGFAKASLAILSTAGLFTFLEVMFRVAGFDFERLKQPGKDVPIYYRTPMLHAGEGVFRRPGPASWRGRVLASYMRMHGSDDAPYSNEQPVEANYDAQGFRNPADLSDWEAVVTGDSFVELGYLPYEELFTTLAAKQLGIRIRNLGVSGTGPVSQTFYVKNYGKAASTKEAVLCFFEGNDLEDLSREIRNRESYRAHGFAWERREQTSLWKAIDEQCRFWWRAGETGHALVTPNAVLTTTRPERAMTVCSMPPSWDRLSRRKQEAVAGALANWAETVRAMRMRPWVMYLPDSHRVFHGLIRYSETNSPVARWSPGEFGLHLGSICTNLDIGFIDTFPALRHEAQAGRVPYNIIGDTHLSADGTRVVARVLVEALSSAPPR